MRLFLILSVLAVAVGLILGMAAEQAHAASCHATGRAPFTEPDNACTPGAGRILSRRDVCTPKDRSVPAAVRRRVVTEYGVPGWTGANGEIDHRWPVFLGGADVEDNLWPEAGPDPRKGQNPKDQLEALVRARVCGSATGYRPAQATMRVRTAVRIFLAGWVAAYVYYVQHSGPRPAA